MKRTARARGPHDGPSPGWLAVAAALAWTAAGCTQEGAGRPEDVLKQLIESLERAPGQPAQARAAYELLSSEAKHNLAERAKRASAVAGRKVAPEEMIAPSRFTLVFTPKRFVSRIEGDWALVTVIGESPATERKQVRCVREGGAWRVLLDLPDLPPIQKRADSPG